MVFSECLLLLLFPDRVEMVLLGRQVSDMLMVRRKSKEEGVKGKKKGRRRRKEGEREGKVCTSGLPACSVLLCVWRCFPESH